MCGICGLIATQHILSNTATSTVAHMNAAIRHRGPDGEGAFSDSTLALAMRRLAIIDLEGGDQPLWNEDKTVGVFMNGEIYNYPELKIELEALGHQFYSHSDTEVLVHLYEEYGDRFVERLRGMFAFCLYDQKQKRVVMARDRFGEKPFYYHHQDNTFSFSSEFHSLLENKAIPRKLNREALDYYLAVGYVPEPLTLVQNIKTLPPGNRLVIENGKITISPYFKIDYPKTGSNLITEIEPAKRLIEPVLRQAVRRQLISDVPVGAFLSGGIDSSTICALAQEEMDQPLDTFTVRFEEADYDESKIAAEVAKKIGSNHHEITVPNDEFSEETFWTIIDHVGLPFPDSSAIPVHMISREIRQHVTVALSGDGGDEIFAGYSDFDWWLKIAPLTILPRGVRKLGFSLAKGLPLPLSASQRRKINRALRASLWGRPGLSFGIHRMQFEEEVDALLGAAKRDYPLQTQAPAGFETWSPLRQAMYYRINHKLVTDMLIKVDRMSMANSLEVRAPLLDPDLYDASLRLGDNLLFQKGRGKIMLREIMRNKLPDSVFNHPKQGFSIPLHKYQNSTYRHLSDQLLGPNGPLAGLLDQSAIKEACDDIFRGTFNESKTTPSRASHRHWSLLLLAGWVKRFDIEIG